MARFKDVRKQLAYEYAKTLHNILIKEASGRGIAYRRGWNGQPYEKSWVSYVFYAAGRDNRKTMPNE